MATVHVIISLLVLLSAAPPITPLTHPADVQALEAFKSAISPSSIPTWSCLASWDFAAGDPCSLPRRTKFICGLACDAATGRIAALTLDSAGYSGPLVLSSLPSLVVLDLSDNAFHGQIPYFSRFPQLRSLSLAGNSFSGHLPNSIASLKSLQDLDFSRNSLSGPLPNSLSSLNSLLRLDLSFNQFSGPIPKLPPNLIQFTIRSNQLSSPLPQSSFAGSIRLEVIDLSGNSLSGPLQSWFFTLPALQQINLSNNTLTRVEIPAPKSGTGASLVAIDLGFNEIEGSVPVNLASYPSLASLSMRHNRLRGPIPWQYGKKESLRRLFLDGNYLIGKPPADFFSGKGAINSGSLGDNCLEGCPRSSELCLPLQKSMDVCKKVYRGRHRS